MATYRHQLMTIRAAARKYGIDPAILWGVYGAETNFGHNLSTSGAGAMGPFQFTGPTARAYGVNPNNFTSSAFGAARYLSQYKSRGVAGMLAAYNAGPAGSPNNPETRAYIPKVQQYARGWAAAARGIGGGAAPAPRRGSSASSGGTPPLTVVTGSTPVTPGGTPKADELAAMQQAGTVGRIPATAPPEPSFGASRFMAKVGGPLALTPPLAGSITPPAGPSLAQQLADVGKQQGPDLGSLTTQTLPGSPVPVGGGATGKRTGKQGRFNGSYSLDSGAGRQPNGVVQAGLKFIGGRVGHRIEVGTTTNHSANVLGTNTPSWHITGNAADVLVGGRDTALGDMIAASALQYAGMSEAQSWREARRGGVWNIDHGGRHFQILWKTYVGGDHHNHVHFGVK